MKASPGDEVSGLRQKQLCERFGWCYREVAQQARAQRLSTHEYVQQKTGWHLIDELYYPPPETPQPRATSGES